MPKKILIIEDDPFLRDMIVKKLVAEGYEADVASDGEQGMEKAENKDLILLDLMLPGMDGYEFLEKTRDNEKIKSIPIVVLSNLVQKEEIEKAKNLGAMDFLVKAQFTPDDITAKVKEILN